MARLVIHCPIAIFARLGCKYFNRLNKPQKMPASVQNCYFIPKIYSITIN